MSKTPTLSAVVLCAAGLSLAAELQGSAVASADQGGRIEPIHGHGHDGGGVRPHGFGGGGFRGGYSAPNIVTGAGPGDAPQVGSTTPTEPPASAGSILVPPPQTSS